MLGLKLNHVSKSGHWRPCEEAFRKGLQKRLNMPLECPPGNSTRYTSTCDTFLCQEIFILCMTMWLTLWNEANLRDLIAATGLVFLLKIGFKSLTFGPMWPGNLMEDLKKQNNRAPTLYYVKLCASFQSHRRIQTGVTVLKCSIWVKIGDYLSPVTSKFDRWPWKTIGHIFSATSSFMLHFIAIYQFKMESGNAKFG